MGKNKDGKRAKGKDKKKNTFKKYGKNTTRGLRIKQADLEKKAEKRKNEGNHSSIETKRTTSILQNRLVMTKTDDKYVQNNLSRQKTTKITPIKNYKNTILKLLGIFNSNEYIQNKFFFSKS